jgi:alkylation response protein AidB-like acyl-CoA dehydrogenase
MAYRVDMRDIHFNLFEVLGIAELSKFERFKDFGVDDYKMILTEAERLAVKVIAPTLSITDRDGARLVDGKVVVPEAVRETLRKYNEGGWGAMGALPQYGGQGLPGSLLVAVGDINTAANTGFGAYQGLTSASANLIQEEGSEYLKETFCEKMFSGQWSGCMVLTEAQAGSAVGDIKTTARRDGDTYLLTGSKIFISGGDHELTENIVHVLLARVEGAPPGVKGLSLFVAPKYLVNPDGTLGEFNHIRATAVEEKMGMHASATCALAYGEDGPCRAWIIGEENRGIQIMFKLMNHARLGVGLQGVSQAAAAYHLALDYAHERIQGVRIQDIKDPAAPRVPIVEHPDVRRMLMTQKAIVEATRSLVYTCAFWLDHVRNSEDEEERERYNSLVELLTPVCKAYSTEMGFESICLALQVHGGYGYCEDYGVSVLLRDAKIGTIYEGTTGIQALDLLGRKVAMRSGALFVNFMGVLNAFEEKHLDHPELGRHVGFLKEAKDALAQTTMHLGSKAMGGETVYPLLYATPYCFMFGHVACSYFILNQAILAYDKLQHLFAEAGVKGDEGQRKFLHQHADARFYANKIQTAKFFTANILPGVYGIARSVASEDQSPVDAIL